MTFPSEWKKDPYLTGQLLSYLGNKRRLLPFLYQAFLQTGLSPHNTTFIDLFAGSGVVSRLARRMKFRSIIANDWEPYSYITQKLYLQETENSLSELFLNRGGLENVLRQLNAIDSLKEGEEQYISRFYAPKSLEQFDPKRERLFYTPDNAIRIDGIRHTIERWYSQESGTLDEKSQRERDILVALLLQEASVHTNTGGVFKGYYKEFGGYGHHALKRILAPIQLKKPKLPEFPADIALYQQDALSLFSQLKIRDSHTLVYLDPPYNIHQYGSNYHLLNTIVLWDKSPLDDTRDAQGYLRKKAGIRLDWQKTKSSFCSRTSALKSFQDLIQSIPADIIMVSYSTDGLIEFEDMLEVLGRKGKAQVLFNPYVKYRGGKKSLSRENRNIEYILWVETNHPVSSGNRVSISRALTRQRAELSMGGFYNTQSETFLQDFMPCQDKPQRFLWKQDSRFSFELTWFGEWRSSQGFSLLTMNEQQKVIKLLARCRCKNRQEELACLFASIDIDRAFCENLSLWRAIIRILRFLAHPKNKEDFLSFYHQGQALLQETAPPDHPLMVQWKKLGEIFHKRATYVGS